MLTVENISANYGSVRVLWDVSISVKKGEICGLFGRNAAGKTTLMNCCLRIMPVSSGRVLIDGKDLAKMRTYEICAQGVGYVSEERDIFPALTVRDHLCMVANASNKKYPEALKVAKDLFPRLLSLQNRYGCSLSGGEAQALKLIMALIRDPKILLLDEPCRGLHPDVFCHFFNEIYRLNQNEGTTVLLVEQNIAAALKIMDSYYFMKEGRIILQNAIENPEKDADLISSHILHA